MFLSWWRKKAKRKQNPSLRQPALRPAVEWLEDRHLLSVGKDGTLGLADTLLSDSQLVANYSRGANGSAYSDAYLIAVATSTDMASTDDGGAVDISILNPKIVSILKDSGGANSVNINGTLFFTATTSEAGTELWKSEGPSGSASLVKDIVPGSESSSPQNLTNVDGTLFFTASNPETGRELWKSDGTAAGTGAVKGRTPGHRHHIRWHGKGDLRLKTPEKPDGSSAQNPAPTPIVRSDPTPTLVVDGSSQPKPMMTLAGNENAPPGAVVPSSSPEFGRNTGTTAETVLPVAALETPLAQWQAAPVTLDPLPAEGSGSRIGSDFPNATTDELATPQLASPADGNLESDGGDVFGSPLLLSGTQLAADSGAEARPDSNSETTLDDGRDVAGDQDNGQHGGDDRLKDGVVFGLNIDLAAAGPVSKFVVAPGRDIQLDETIAGNEMAGVLNEEFQSRGPDRSLGSTPSGGAAVTSSRLKGYNSAASSPSGTTAMSGKTIFTYFSPTVVAMLGPEGTAAAANLPSNSAATERHIPATAGERMLPFFFAAFDSAHRLGQDQSRELAAGAVFVQDVHSAANSSPESWVSGNGNLWGFLFSYALVLPFGPKRHQPTIMLAEGDEATRDAMTVLLVHEGYLVLPAATAHDALGVLRAPISPIDVVLLDTHLPDVSGIHLCQRLRELYPTLPVLICTGEAEPSEVAQLLKLGVQHYLRKPIVLHELLTTVRSLLR